MNRTLPWLPTAFLLLFIAPPLLAPGMAQGQEEVIPVLRGEVRAGDAPLPGAMVVLHQVSSETSGEIDSIQAGPDGAFSLVLPRLPEHGVRSEVYFASVRHRGLLYFGPAITGPAQLDSIYLIRAYDTLSVPTGGATLPLSVRNVFLEKVEGGWAATDFFQLSQGGDRTLYSPHEGVTWQYPLPPSAVDFEVGQADLAPDAVRFQDGNLAFFAPIPPGERFFLVRYRLPSDDFVIPMPGSTERMEILVREPGPQMEFPPLRPSTPVELEGGGLFRRWEGAGLVDVDVDARTLAGPFPFRAEWLAVILAGLLGGVGVFAFRKGGRGRAEAPNENIAAPSRSEVLLAIARLDEEHLRADDPGPEAEAAYRSRRKDLLRQLKRHA